jgi:hypothetical protein
MPDLVRPLWITTVILLGACQHGGAPAPGPFEASVNAGVVAGQATIRGARGELQPVSASRDGRGVQSEFLEGIVLLKPANAANLQSFLDRYDGRIIGDDIAAEPPAGGDAVPGAKPRKPAEFQVRINLAKVDLARLPGTGSAAGLTGKLEFSSEAGMRTFAGVLDARAAGFRAEGDYISHGLRDAARAGEADQDSSFRIDAPNRSLMTVSLPYPRVPGAAAVRRPDGPQPAALADATPIGASRHDLVRRVAKRTSWNLIQNPGAETIAHGQDWHLVDWKRMAGLASPSRLAYSENEDGPTTTGPGPNERGAYLFSGSIGQGASGILQSIPLDREWWIAVGEGRVDTHLSAYLGGSRTSPDLARVKVTFIGARGRLLGTLLLPTVGAREREGRTGLLPVEGNDTVPAGTESLRVSITFTPRGGGRHHVAFADNLELTLSEYP